MLELAFHGCHHDGMPDAMNRGQLAFGKKKKHQCLVGGLNPSLF
jgi:hypothetical protein